MPRRSAPLLAGHYYHLYNRGNNRSSIFPDFRSLQDFESLADHGTFGFFLQQLREYVTAKDARVICYALLPNHYHLLVEALTDDLSHALQLFAISYTKAINKKFKRVGALFQGAFKAREVDTDEYLLHLSRYIHLNPVRWSLVPRAQDWPYSSYAEFIGLRNGSLPHPEVVLRQFQTSEVSKTSEVLQRVRRKYQTFVESYQAADRRTVAHLLFQTSEVSKTSEV